MWLKKFNHSFLVDASVEEAWDFYTDLHHLEVITPKKLDLKIIESSGKKITMGQTASFSSKIITRITWKTKITFCKPYRYVDEMSNSLFKRWKHTHVFDKINEICDRERDDNTVINLSGNPILYGWIYSYFNEMKWIEISQLNSTY